MEREKAKTGVLLINVGSPDQPDIESVKKYLKAFLMDPLVMGMPYPLRWLLVNRSIVPKRAASSADKYQQIWCSEGSPLIIHTQALGEKLQQKMGSQYVVKFAMRYGNPSIEGALAGFKAILMDRLIVFPLYPQYAFSTTDSAIQQLHELAKKLDFKSPINVVPPFFRHPGFLDAFAAISKPVLGSGDYVLFSFHGLPVSHIRRADYSRSHCLLSHDCCETLSAVNQRCYRAQCYETARGLAELLGLTQEKYCVAFQSRMGPTQWIPPYTSERLKELPQHGVKRLVVICPSFVADCLETLEEIDIRGRKIFLEHGGESFAMVRSLNDSDDWVQAVASMLLV